MEDNIKANPFLGAHLSASERFILSIIRGVFKVLGGFSTQSSAKFALRLFMSPPKYSSMPREAKAINSSSSTTLNILNEQIVVRTWGQGPVVLFSHGWGGSSASCFSFIAPLVKAGFKVVSFDAPAHGYSSGKQTHLLAVAKTLSEVAKSVGAIHAVIGHSFGCATALYALHQFKLQTKNLVLIASFADINWPLISFQRAFLLDQKIIDEMQTIALHRFGQFEGVDWRWSQLSPTHTLKHYTGRLMLIHDVQDVEVPYSQLSQLIAVSTNASVVRTNGLGHRKINSRPVTISSCVAFIRNNP